MKKLHSLLSTLLLITFMSVPVFSQSVKLGIPLTRRNLIEADNFIKKYAPADSAFRLLNQMANINNYIGRPDIGRTLLKIYMGYFPNRQEYIQRQIDIKTNQMLLTQNPELMKDSYDTFINEEAPSREAFVAVQKIAEPYVKRRSWDSAIKIYQLYKPLFYNMSDYFTETISILEAKEEGLEVHNLGSVINSYTSEWDPNPTPDGCFLYFSCRGRRGGLGKSDVWYSEMKNGKWKAPVNAGKSINGKNEETIDNVTTDGNGLFLSGTFEGTLGNFDIFYAERVKNGWGKLKHFDPPINSEHTDEAAGFSSDGKALIFSSDRPGGIGDFHPHNSMYEGNDQGNMDIYVSIMSDTGWTEPINIGPTINTPWAERSPYLHPDGKTLYFSSNGHPSVGGMDVFKTTRLREDSWTEWSKPVNLGKEINTADDDWGYTIAAQGDSAFFAGMGREGGLGQWDIYTVKLPEDARPDPVVIIKGWVTDTEGNPLSVDIKWEDLASGRNIGRLKSNPDDGTYVIALPLGKNVGYYAEKEGYYPAAKNIDLRQLVSEPNVNENIVMVSIKEMKENGTKVRINNIFFDFDKAEIKSESFPELRRLASFIKKNPGFKIVVEGHTDNVGAEKYNKELSLKRAENIVKYLVDRGCLASRFEAKGLGTSKPVGDNVTDFGRSQNRRVEIWFLPE